MRVRAKSFHLQCVGFALHISAFLCSDSIDRHSCSVSSNFKGNTKDWALVGHVIDTCKVRDELQCAHKCLSRDGCQSYNYGYTPEDEDHVCELNKNTAEHNPLDFRPFRGLTYYEPVGKTEPLGCPCQNGGKCVDAHSPTCRPLDRFRCDCPIDLKGRHCEIAAATNCQELKNLGANTSGAYFINPGGLGPILVFCDQITDGGGWTVVQRRFAPYTTNFTRGWVDYENGFGEVSGEHWLGNDVIHRLTRSPRVLRIELRDENSSHVGLAIFNYFQISDRKDNYRLELAGYIGDIENSIYDKINSEMQNENHMQFTTFDRDNDNSPNTCGGRGGWWLNHCGHVNLNRPKGIKWDFSPFTPMSSKMMVR